MVRIPEPFRLGAELVRSALMVGRVEHLRRHHGPRAAAAAVRQLASGTQQRSAVDRARLQRAIRFLDSFFRDSGNCYRRVLLEMALDRGAAAEPLMMGLPANGAANAGHAWLGRLPDGRSYDAVVSV